MKTKVCIAGATGKMGSHLTRAIYESNDLQIVSALAKNYNGELLGDVIGLPGLNIEIEDDIVFALRKKPDVLVDFTNAVVVKRNVIKALEENVSVVIGTSGLTDDDFEQIGKLAAEKKIGVIASGNFSITAGLMMKFAELAAVHLPMWEIIEYSYEGKIDAPSGTARELASRLSKIKLPENKVTIQNTVGEKESRGATIAGTQIHALRLPGYHNSCEIIFGMGAERLTIRHDSIEPGKPYADGALMAIRKVRTLTGLHRGLDKIMNL